MTGEVRDQRPAQVIALGYRVVAQPGVYSGRPDQADRLAETLLAWLESADNAGAAARHLHVHPQTVRYRLRQLTELFGDRLSDPDARFTLQVALRIRRLTRVSCAS